MTQDELHKLLEYNPSTGVFIWKVKPAKQIPIGAVAGYTAKNGYVCIRISGTLYYAHRLAYLYMTGAWPKKLVDHDNRIRSDNCWDNLTEATYLQNARNCSLSKNNSSGVNGVVWEKRRQKWRATITNNYAEHFLGYFDELPLAIDARKIAETAHNFHPNHGIAT